MLFAPEVLVLLPQRSEVVSIVAQHAAVRLHEVVRARHEDSGARRRPACARDRTLDAVDGDSTRVNLHAIDATLNVDPAPTQDVPKRCHACSKGVGIGARIGSQKQFFQSKTLLKLE